MKRTLSYAAAVTVVIILTLCLSGCAKPDPVETVKAMVMTDFPTTTIGKAFDAAFNHPTWNSFQTANGQTVVEFNGTVTEAMHQTMSKYIWLKINKDSMTAKAFERDMIIKLGPEKIQELEKNHPDAKTQGFNSVKMLLQYYIDHYHTPVDAPVKFQFVMNIADPKKSSLEHFSCGDESWKDLNEKFVLSMVYN